ncbi:unnamed protein product [Merluccius merluccius]
MLLSHSPFMSVCLSVAPSDQADQLSPVRGPVSQTCPLIHWELATGPADGLELRATRVQYTPRSGPTTDASETTSMHYGTTAHP